MRVLRDPHAWSADRLHLTPDAHQRVALRTCEVLGLQLAADWREPWPPAEGTVSSQARAWLAARRTDLRWARLHAAPWPSRGSSPFPGWPSWCSRRRAAPAPAR